MSKENTKKILLILFSIIVIIGIAFTIIYFKNKQQSTPNNDNIQDPKKDNDENVGSKIYAHWDAKSYTVTFDGNNGTPSYTNKTVVYDAKYESLPTASRTGYIFQGWFTAASGGTKISSTSKVTTASNHNLYAQWKSKPPQAQDTCQYYGTNSCCNCADCH